MMIVNRNFCKVLTVFFFFEVIVLIGFGTQYIMPGFQYSNNYLARGLVLFVVFVLTAGFYKYITVPKANIDKSIIGADGRPIDSDKLIEFDEINDTGSFLIKGEKDYLKLALIIIVLGVIILAVIDLFITII